MKFRRVNNYTNSVSYDPIKKYIGYMLINLSDSNTTTTTTLFLYEERAPVTMLVSPGKIKSTVAGQYNSSEITIISSTYPGVNDSAIKVIDAS